MSTPQPAVAGMAGMAQVYNSLLGCKDNMSACREIARQVAELCPEAPGLAVRNRLYLGHAIRQACEDGVRQVIDAGCGFPVAAESPGAPNTHELVPEGVRVAYLDVDAWVVNHALALMDGPGVIAFRADLRDTGEVLAWCEDSGWDLAEPVCLVLGSVLHFMPPAEAREAIAAYTGRLAPGSRVIVTVRCCDDPVLSAAIAEKYTVAVLHDYGTAEVEALFGGLELADPGVERLTGLRDAAKQDKPGLFMACGTGVKK